MLSDVLQLQTMVKGLLQQIGNLIPLRYFVLDGYFGHNNALQMAKQCRLHLISKLRTDAALHLPPTTPYAGKGRPRTTASVSTHDRLTQNTVSLPTRSEI